MKRVNVAENLHGFPAIILSDKDNAMSKTKKTVLLALLTALALVAHFFEGLYVLPLPVPGIKLGFSNVFILIALVVFGFAGGALVTVCKLLLSFLLFANPVSFALSFCGGVLSFLVMGLVWRYFRGFSMVGISILGAVFHVTGQIICAAFLIQNSGIVLYLPALLLTSVVTGTFTGLCAYYLVKVLKKII